jgi:hypothetical protein
LESKDEARENSRNQKREYQNQIIGEDNKEMKDLHMRQPQRKSI